MKQPAIKVDDVFKSFGDNPVLKGLSLEVAAGEVHAIMGANGAGKSTLMKLLIGDLPFERGRIQIAGKELAAGKKTERVLASQRPIGMVYQELNLVRSISVMENIWLGREPRTAWGTVDFGKMQQQTQALTAESGIAIEPQLRVSKLSMALRQQVEILKALSYDAEILILDEPTSALSEHEVAKLFAIVRHLKELGKTILYISHRMDEIRKICDTLSVLRDGLHVSTVPLGAVTTKDIVRDMVGISTDQFFPKRSFLVDPEPQSEVFAAKGLALANCYGDISFRLHRGEVLGFAGLVGSGRTEIAQTLMGMRTPDRGTMRLNRQPYRPRGPSEAIRSGLIHIPEDRRLEGLTTVLSIRYNTTLSDISKVLTKIKSLSAKKERDIASRFIARLEIACTSAEQKCQYLSGGNQQKVVVARILHCQPQIIIMDEPTRGIDVKAKSQIFTLIDELTQAGIAIVLISSELEEVTEMSDRVLVMAHGQVKATLPQKEADYHRVLALCMGD